MGELRDLPYDLDSSILTATFFFHYLFILFLGSTLFSCFLLEYHILYFVLLTHAILCV